MFSMSKLIPYLLLICLLLVACDSQNENNATSSTDNIPSGDSARVVNVIDGDTIDVDLDGASYRVRYIGVDTPERDEPYYQEATDFNRKLLAGDNVILVRDVSETDQYGRLLRYVYLPDGTFVNAELIQEGYARIVTFPPDVAQTDYFTELQAGAREAERGLWSLSELKSLPDGCNTCSKNAHDCRDFNTQITAQRCYEACLEISGEDIHNLDGGGDGIVCESLP